MNEVMIFWLVFLILAIVVELMTLGLTEQEAEERIVNGFLK